MACVDVPQDTHRDDDSVYASSYVLTLRSSTSSDRFYRVGSGSFKTSLASSVLNYKYVAGSVKFELVADRSSLAGVRYEAREGQMFDINRH